MTTNPPCETITSMTNFTPGQSVRYYHAMLDQAFDAKVDSVNKRGVEIVFKLVVPQFRFLTHKQAERCLNVTS